MDSERPSHKEISRKLKLAIERLEAGAVRFANPEKSMTELDRLEIDATAATAMVLKACQDEIRVENYVGARPPLKSYEAKIKDAELFAFAWESQTFWDSKMYLKFCHKGDFVFLVSLHKDKGGSHG
jgi:hypothetical protein